MKKINLFKVVVATLLVVVLLSYIVPASKFGASVVGTSITPIPLFDVFTNVYATFGYFAQIAVFMLMLGGFYGILTSIEEYNYLIQKVARNVREKNREKIFIVATITIFALLSSFTSLPLTLFVFVPMFISVILLMGYDKLTALASTVGAISIGLIGSLYSYAIVGNITNSLELEVTNSIATRAVLLVFGIALLSLYVIRKMQKVTSKEKNEEEDYDPLYIETRKQKVNVIPMIIILSLILVLYVLGFVYWQEMFKTAFFIDMDTWFKALKIGDVEIMKYIVGSAGAFGKWAYADFTIVLLVISFVLSFIYNIKINEYFVSFTNGMKKMVPTAGLLVLAMSVLVVSNATSTQELTGTVIAAFDFIGGMFKGLNVVAYSLPTILAAIVNVDPYYYVQFTLPAAESLIADPSTNAVLALLYQTMYGFTTLFAPTSLILLAGLSYLNVNYVKWLKYIAMLLLQLYFVIMAMLVIVKLIS